MRALTSWEYTKSYTPYRLGTYCAFVDYSKKIECAEGAQSVIVIGMCQDSVCRRADKNNIF